MESRENLDVEGNLFIHQQIFFVSSLTRYFSIKTLLQSNIVDVCHPQKLDVSLFSLTCAV